MVVIVVSRMTTGGAVRQTGEQVRVAADGRRLVARKVPTYVRRRAATQVIAQSQTENGTVCRHDTRAVQQMTQHGPIDYLHPLAKQGNLVDSRLRTGPHSDELNQTLQA